MLCQSKLGRFVAPAIIRLGDATKLLKVLNCPMLSIPSFAFMDWGLGSLGGLGVHLG